MLFGSKDRPTTKGQQTEAAAEIFLRQQGLTTLQKNFRCKAGEIDLIMQKNNTLIFVEVRLRSNSRFSSAAESVTWHKQQKIIRAAQYYLLEKRLSDKVSCRFDVIAFDRADNQPQWIKNAFDG